jgi:hypothetical protein
MARSPISSELETRIQFLENPANQGHGFTQHDRIWLIMLGIVGPVFLLTLGWGL